MLVKSARTVGVNRRSNGTLERHNIALLYSGTDVAPVSNHILDIAVLDAAMDNIPHNFPCTILY